MVPRVPPDTTGAGRVAAGARGDATVPGRARGKAQLRYLEVSMLCSSMSFLNVSFISSG